ncbi:MAG: hypothetical protein QMC80_00195 [Thermoplasmatales archaeon]|nr:hypothetical protein [Thermoplasmatales archaeon]
MPEHFPNISGKASWLFREITGRAKLFLDMVCAFSTKGRASSHLSLMHSKHTFNVFDISSDSLSQILHLDIFGETAEFFLKFGMKTI